jgi:hypothetical protein
MMFEITRKYEKSRKVVTRSPMRLVGRFPSIKNGRQVEYESQIERDFIYRLEACPFVNEYWEQPPAISYHHEGALHSYTPDFVVSAVSGEFYAEIKPDQVLKDPIEMARLLSIRRALAAKKKHFRLFTASEIRRSPWLENAELVNDFRYPEFDPTKESLKRLADIKWVRSRISATGIARRLGEDSIYYSVLPLVARQLARISFAKPFSIDSIVWFPKEENVPWDA